MDDNKAIHRLEMRITALQQRRIELLMDKKATKKASVVNEAIKQMFDRDIGELPVDKKRK